MGVNVGGMCHSAAMTAADLDLALVRKLQRFGSSDASPTVLLGAGASVNSGVPSWDQLVVSLLVRSGAVETEAAGRRLLSKQEPTIAVEAARAAAGEGRWMSLVRECLIPEDEDPTPSSLHEAVAEFVVTGPGSDVGLITLNFDTLLEQALHEAGSSPFYATGSDEAPLTQEGETIVHHLHGVVERSKTDAVVLTFSDFNEILVAGEPWQERIIAESVSRGPVLIAGTSYRDPDLRQWMHRALQAAGPVEPPVVMLAREGFEIGQKEFDEISAALISQWEAIGLSPVLIQDHADAGQLIRESRWVDVPGYVSPRERSRRLWEAHQRSFAETQETYNRYLRADAEALREECGVETLNLTLWLADEDGMLARWSTQDRIYVDPTAVRRVPTGHDSPWVAAQAMSAEGLLAQNIENSPTRRWKSVFGRAVEVGGVSGRWPSHVTGALTVAFGVSKEEVGQGWDRSFRLLTERWAERINHTVSENEASLDHTHGEERA